MLQSRLAARTVNKTASIWSSWWKRGLSQESAPSQGGASAPGVAPLPTGLPADPAVHASEPLGEVAEEGVALSATATKPSPQTPANENEPLIPPAPPTSSSPKIEHTGVGSPSKPNFHQRRPFSNSAAQQQLPNELSDVSCAGLDGSPWPDDAEGQKAQKRDQEADNKEYFKDHKASPLSEVEFVDSRKPVTQATDHAGDKPIVASYYGGNMGLTVWKEEQLDSAEETMMRAAELWKWNKMRGDPDSPHGRVLRELRGEYW